MPRFKPYDTSQNLLIPVNLSEQLVEGSFEYTLNYLVDHVIGTKPVYQFCGYVKHCRVCPLKEQCLRKPDQKSARSVVFSYKPEGYDKPDALQLMKDKIDSPAGKRMYSKRLGIVEPPYGHMQGMGLTELTLRGRKANAQWQFMCAVQNLKKIHGYDGEKLQHRIDKVQRKR